MPAMPAGPGPTHYPVQQQPRQQRGGSSNKPWYVATAVVAVVVIAVVSIIIATSGSDAGDGNVAGADCSTREADGSGMSECMRKVAGAVAENNDCKSGAAAASGAQPIETPGATASTCVMDDTHTVMYMHFGASDTADGSELSGVDTAKQYIDTVIKQLDGVGAGGDPEKGDWEGDGLSGTYAAIDIGGGSGMVLFSVRDSPVAGALMNIDIGGSGDVGDLLHYFDQHVKPGGDGGGS
jgi:hypothetical protein